MEFWQSVLRVLDTSMEQPQLYGWFHILWLVITAVYTVLLCRWMGRASADRVRKMVLITALVVIALEIYKQINFNFGYENGITFDYAWYAFPFQFCSTPMYVGLLAGLTRKGRVHEAACAYLATYAVFAGACVMFYPSTVFVSTIGINIQTMICHGSMIAVGAALYASGHVKAEHRTILKAAPVFLVCVLLAALMNELAHQTGLLQTDTFDMFFISPYCEPSLPVYSLVQAIVTFPWCLGLYVAGFTTAAYLLLLLAMGLRQLGKKKIAV